MLSQLGADGHEHPVGYCSKKFLPPEQHYSTIEKECTGKKRVESLWNHYVIEQ